jgi:hypothetical protein
MTTYSDIKREPETYLGAGTTSEDADLFIAACQAAQSIDPDLSESDAVDAVWGDGDWYRRATELATNA